MSFWSDKRITVTGGAGFLGSFVVEKLKEPGCRDIFVPLSSRHKGLPALLRNRLDQCRPLGKSRAAMAKYARSSMAVL
jgi:nucleoside-diphosphate-sugar epimerase